MLFLTKDTVVASVDVVFVFSNFKHSLTELSSFTCNKDAGAFVPIPTLPVPFIHIRSVIVPVTPVVLNDNKPAVVVPSETPPTLTNVLSVEFPKSTTPRLAPTALVVLAMPIDWISPTESRPKLSALMVPTLTQPVSSEFLSLRIPLFVSAHH